MNSNQQALASNSAPRALFLTTTGVVLGITGLAKTFSSIGPARALDVLDPLLGTPFRQLLLLVGLVELLIAFFCLFTDKQRFSLLAVAWKRLLRGWTFAPWLAFQCLTARVTHFESGEFYPPAYLTPVSLRRCEKKVKERTNCGVDFLIGQKQESIYPLTRTEPTERFL